MTVQHACKIKAVVAGWQRHCIPQANGGTGQWVEVCMRCGGWWRNFRGHKRQKRQQNGSTANKMLSWWWDGGSTTSVKSCSVLHLRSISVTSNNPYFLFWPYSDSYLFSDLVISCYLVISLFCFHSPLLIRFCPTLSYHHAIVNHVVPYPSCSRIMCWLNLMFVQSLLPPNSSLRSRSAPWLQTPPVFKPTVSIDTNQSDY